MSIDITMPRLSDTMETGTVIKWNVAEGDEVSSGDIVADIETDKATMELTVFDDGRVAKIIVGEGKSVNVGEVIAVLAEEGEDTGSVSAGQGAKADGNAKSAATGNGASDDGDGGGSATAVAEPPAAKRGRPAAAASGDAGEAAGADGAGAGGGGGRLRISPVARRLAEEHQIDLGSITGSGPHGRIIKRDVMSAVEAAQETAASRAPAASAPAGAVKGGGAMVPATPVSSSPSSLGLPAGRRPLSNMRQTIARRLVESKTTIPHYQVTMTFDMDPLMELRRTLNEQLAPMGIKLSVNDFLIRSCALAMYRHPDFNASFDGDAIIVHPDVNVGMAISVGEERGGGLVVGVIRNADRKSLRVISEEAKHLATKARGRGLSIEEMSDSTFTLSNLGMYGVEHFTAIINPPNSAILAVGGAQKKPVVRNDELTIGHEMSATLSLDHRVIDGAMAAEYLVTLKESIENPATLLV